MAGALLARGRRTASSWFRAAGVNDAWDRFYELLVSVGKVASSLTLPILKLIVKRFDLLNWSVGTPMWSKLSTAAIALGTTQIVVRPIPIVEPKLTWKCCEIDL